ncbi:conserved unknown protein [Ectocarpus siliculosus]|uniref:Uncharacterized protein n=1 Tax=Ectocarpus siliculosus TaxID=2880 RepID=D7FX98_ECTSI|nr:conserved unknown protein [Ectocarpus siliculosus]|eukprot:CBJ49276.1 conserved unknown protein [Ectocarpus siliculosus]
MTAAGENGSVGEVVNSGAVQISEQDDREYRHVTFPNKMQVLLISDPETDKEAAAMDVRVGQTSDPAHLQGTAHFCEHMLFLGTGKYPDEDYYNSFLNSNGGSSNAFTANEDTNYYFDVNAGHLDGALEIFSRFFVDPLFTESATGRELTAIDNENSKNLNSDPWRIVQVLKKESSELHPWHQFGTGNAKTLGEEPKDRGVDVRAELLKFHSRYYSANLMRLVVLGKGSLDELQAMAVEKFSQVVNTDASVPSFGGNVPFGPEQVKRRIHVVPVKESRDVTMSWPLPPIEQHFRSKPDSYLSHLVGHEGSGSLLSLLKAKGWANGLSAGPYESATDWANFVVSVECTEKGFEHVNEIVSMTYQYLNLLREEGVQEWIHLETQAIAAMNFRFSSKGDPSSYACRLAGNMQVYPPDLAVAGQSLRYDYDPDLVRELLGHMVPSNMLLMVVAREFKGETDKVEPYYGSEYSCEAISDDLIESWETCGRREELRLPEPNPVIATDFTLRSPPPQQQQQEGGAAASSAPVGPSLIRDDDSCRVWHKTDAQFRKPKLNVRIRLVNPVLYDSPESLVLANLLVDLLKEDLNEELYMASEAGLGLNLYLTKEALCLSLGGYSHKMKVLLERVVHRLGSFGDTLAQDKEDSNDDKTTGDAISNGDANGNSNGGGGGGSLFQRMRQKLLKRYKNEQFNTPYQHAVSATQSCMEVPRWNNEDRLKAMEGPGITVPAMLAFVPRLLSVLYMEMLVHGNATATEALGLASVVIDGLKTRPLPPNLWPEDRVVDLSLRGGGGNEAGTTALDLSSTSDKGATGAGEEGESGSERVLGPEYRRSLACPNPEETNSAVELTFQVCLDGVRERALLNLFTHLVKDKCFDHLRTKEQLGYLVWSGGSVHGGYVYNARFIVQSNDRSPRYLDGRVESFIAGFREFGWRLISFEDEKKKLRPPVPLAHGPQF